MRNMTELIRTLSPLRMAPNSNGADQCARILQEDLPFKVHEFSGGSEVNGWICPMKWEPSEAKIRDLQGNLVYDGMWHPLAVIGYSQPFTGKVLRAELKQHLFYPDAFDDALVYHCDLFYKPFRKEWGFSVTQKIYDAIDESKTYEVDLRTAFEAGTMKVLEYVLPGDSEESIVMNAHNCHASCCNDDLANIAVGIEGGDAQALVVVGVETPAQGTASCRTAYATSLPARLRAEWDAAWLEDVEPLIESRRWHLGRAA